MTEERYAVRVCRTGTSHVSGNGAYTYISGSQTVNVGCMRQIVIASKN